tara:strand:+ start:36 stop:497 length:462 start_codon:yes stop_codon:yes gene_type:complete
MYSRIKRTMENWWMEKNRNMDQTELRYFKKDLSEFDSPDQPGSGLENMDMNFVKRLDQARHLTMGTPFKITSGFRSQEYHHELSLMGYQTAKNSAHLKGLAADISTPDSRSRFKIIRALMEVGFTRFGIGKSYLHVDASPENEKSQEVCWDYY